MEGQRIERELRSELEGVVTKDLHDAMVNRLHNLEESESKLKVEVMRLKEISEVASHQAEAVQSQQESRDKELLSLRKQLYDIQMENDDKTVIGKVNTVCVKVTKFWSFFTSETNHCSYVSGKLHHHIVALQVSEGMAIKKLETAQSKVKNLHRMYFLILYTFLPRENCVFERKFSLGVQTWRAYFTSGTKIGREGSGFLSCETRDAE